MKVLITGVAGLLGSHLSRYLLDRGYDVIGIDDLSGGYKDFIDTRITESGKFYAINLAVSESLKKVFEDHKPDYVYHFAAYAAEGLSPFIRNFNYTNNLISSVNVINNCIAYNVKKLIFTSSMAVYGIGIPPFTEDQLPSPEDPYGIAKYAVELDILLAAKQFDLNYSIIRPHNVIGMYQNIWDKYRNVIGIWVRNTLAGTPLLVYGDGTQKRAFSDIKYYMQPFEKLMTESVSDRQTYNIGADHEYEINHVASLVKKIGEEFGYKPTIEHVEARHEVKNAYCNHDKAKQQLSFEDNTDIETTIRDMFIWAKDQPLREVKKMDYEIEKNLYSFWK